MENTSTVIAEALTRMDDDELVERWKNGMFSDEARPIAAAELRSRRIDPENYALPIDTPPPEPASDFSSSDRPIHVRPSMNIIDRGYTGQIRLWKLFWFGYVIPLFPLTIALGVFKETSSSWPSWLSFLFVMLALLYQAWLAIAIWRCSPNVKLRVFFYLGRAFSCFLGLMVLAAALQLLQRSS